MAENSALLTQNSILKEQVNRENFGLPQRGRVRDSRGRERARSNSCERTSVYGGLRDEEIDSCLGVKGSAWRERENGLFRERETALVLIFLYVCFCTCWLCDLARICMGVRKRVFALHACTLARICTKEWDEIKWASTYVERHRCGNATGCTVVLSTWRLSVMDGVGS